MRVVVQYLQKRGSVFRFRRPVPPDLWPTVGRKEIIKSFGKVDAATALQLCLQQSAIWDAKLEAFRNGNYSSDPNLVASIEAEARRLLDAGAAAIDAKRGEARELARIRAELAGLDKRALERIGFFGPAKTDHQLHSINITVAPDWDERLLHPVDREVLKAVDAGGTYVPGCVSIRDAYLQDLQRYGDSRVDEKAVRVAIESMASLIGSIDIRQIRRTHILNWVKLNRSKGLTDSTIRRRLNAIQGVVNRWHRDAGITVPDLFGGLKLEQAGRDARLPFHSTHLAAIEAYLVKGGALPQTADMLRLMRGTGIGVLEMIGLERADVVLDADLPYLHIRENSLRPRLKTKCRKRIVPLVGAALAAVRRALENPKLKVGLFYDRPADATVVSGRLNAAIRRAGVPHSKRLTIYSFRHTLVAALRLTGAPQDIARYMMGHRALDSHSKYGSPTPLLAQLTNCLETALVRLGDVALSDFSNEERIAP